MTSPANKKVFFVVSKKLSSENDTALIFTDNARVCDNLNDAIKTADHLNYLDDASYNIHKVTTLRIK